jgi:hypothetical protein
MAQKAFEPRAITFVERCREPRCFRIDFGGYRKSSIAALLFSIVDIINQSARAEPGAAKMVLSREFA